MERAEDTGIRKAADNEETRSLRAKGAAEKNQPQWALLFKSGRIKMCLIDEHDPEEKKVLGIQVTEHELQQNCIAGK